MGLLCTSYKHVYIVIQGSAIEDFNTVIIKTFNVTLKL